MKKIILTLIVMSATAHATCDWHSNNHDHKNSRYNPCETTLNTANVHNLVVVDSISQNNGVQVAPVIANDVLFYGDLGGNVYARDANNLNTLKWTVNLGGPVDAPATVHGSVVYVATGDIKLHALDITTGAEIPGFPIIIDPTISAQGGGDVLAAPVVADNIVIVPTVDGAPFGTDVHPARHQSINAFNATTGAFIWRRIIQPQPYGAQGGSFSTAAIDTDLKIMFIGTSNSDNKPVSIFSDALLALDYRNGDLIWSHQFTKDDAWGPLYPCDPDYDVGASANLFEIKLLDVYGKKLDVVGVASKAGIYKVFERSTGQLIWSTNTIPEGFVAAATTAPGAAYDSVNELIYVPTLIDNSGEPLGALTILQSNGNADASAILTNIIFNVMQYQITALDARTGAKVWTAAFVGVGSGSVTAANGVVYFDNWRGEVRALDALTGHVKFYNNTTFSNPTFLGGATTITNGKLFVPFGIFPGAPGGIKVFGLAP